MPIDFAVLALALLIRGVFYLFLTSTSFILGYSNGRMCLARALLCYLSQQYRKCKVLRRDLLSCALMYAVRGSCGPNNLFQRSLNCGAKPVLAVSPSGPSLAQTLQVPEMGTV